MGSTIPGASGTAPDVEMGVDDEQYVAAALVSLYLPRFAQPAPTVA